jgi:hypothetical protein
MSGLALKVNDVSSPHFTTKSVLDGEAIVVDLSGNADAAVYDSLRAFLEAIDHEARRLSVHEMIFILRDLYFMNSSCLSLLARMISALVETVGERPYRLRFRPSASLRWQRRSLQAISSVAKGLVLVD